MSLGDLRRDYQMRGLVEGDLDANPIRQARDWLDQAIAANLPEPNAMTLATVSAAGRPSARMVLLKGIDDAGFIFYTNYTGRKGQELAANPYAALVLFWVQMERQIRIEGRVEQVAPDLSDAYFHSRPVGSQLGAAVSPQSQVIPDRAYLETRLADLAKRYRDQEIPRPAHWGGYRVVPDALEFWQGRPNRLHDRLRYRRDNTGAWQIERLAP